MEKTKKARLGGMRLFAGGEGMLVAILIVMFIALSFATDKFLTTNNIMNLVRQTSINGILAIGMTFVIVSAGIDLSVGSTLGLSGIIVALMLSNGMPMISSLLTAALSGVAIGLLNGVIIHKGGVPPFITTLGIQTATRGAIMLISEARMVSGLPQGFVKFAQQSLKLGPVSIPMLFLCWMVVVAVGAFILSKTVFGRYIYSIGSNPESARLSGINIAKTTYAIYAFSGLTAAVAGILLTSRLGNGIPTSGTGYETEAIAAAVIGGASLSGAEGTILGTALGAIIMSTLNNGGTLLGINPFSLQIATGVLIIVAVLLDKWKKKRS